MRRLIIPAVCVLALAACSPQSQVTAQATVTKDLATVQQQLSKVIALYGVGKGFVPFAEIQYPSLKPELDKAVAKLDPLVAAAQGALDDAGTTAPQIEALIAALTTQVNDLVVKASSGVKVTAG